MSLFALTAEGQAAITAETIFTTAVINKKHSMQK
jgi:hypothetical protein